MALRARTVGLVAGIVVALLGAHALAVVLLNPCAGVRRFTVIGAGGRPSGELTVTIGRDAYPFAFDGWRPVVYVEARGRLTFRGACVAADGLIGQNGGDHDLSFVDFWPVGDRPWVTTGTSLHLVYADGEPRAVGAGDIVTRSYALLPR